MRLLVKYPTRKRWTKFKQNFTRFLELANNPSDIQFIVSVDDDDPIPQDVIDMIHSLSPKTTVDIGPHIGKISAVNRSIPDDGWDLMLLAADDIRPTMPGWDDRLRSDMHTRFPTGFGLLNYRAEIRLGADWRNLVTVPVMGRGLYTYFGYVYHPSYMSEFCDNEMTEVCTRIERIAHIDEQPFVHEWELGRDGLTDINIKMGVDDRLNYERRRQTNFM